MTPLSFDPTTAREVTGDARSREIEEKARKDADLGIYEPPSRSSLTYWDGVTAHMATVVYAAQYKRRAERNKRD